MCVIYKITNLINGKCYIGKTVKDNAKSRWNDHINGYHPNSLIHKAISKYGVENFTFEELEYPTSPEILNIRERYLIKKYNSLAPNGYNLTVGGDGCLGFEMSEKTKQELSNKRKGKPWTERQREVLSKARIGNNNAGKAVAMVDPQTKEILAVFKSAKEASRVSGIYPTNITRACKNPKLKARGYYWIYV